MNKNFGSWLIILFLVFSVAMLVIAVAYYLK